VPALSLVLLLLSLASHSALMPKLAGRLISTYNQQSLDSLRWQYGFRSLGRYRQQRPIVWQAGFGFQDVENQIPATPDTPYRTAPNNKTFASMLLMKCVEPAR
jgi:CubicO group peptidase (beta-lactamase class C family)